MKNLLLLFLKMTIVLQFAVGNTMAGSRIVVDKNGKGDFLTINAALNSLDSNSAVMRGIFVRNGVYAEKIFITKSNIILEGESREGVFITQSISRDIWRCSHDSDWGVATININANDITLKDITIQNNYGVENTTDSTIACTVGNTSMSKVVRADGHQMALRLMGGTRLKAINVHFIAYGGDTVSPWNVTDGMYYFKDCTMEGGVDFYCPRGWAYAENCTFIAHTGEASIWHDGSAHEDSKSVLKDCSFRGFNGFNLGRYHRDAQFYLINCHFASDMADKDIFLVPTSNIIDWGRRVYYYNCHRDGGDYAWFADNLSSAKGNPSPGMINAKWVFKNRWNPEKDTVFSKDKRD